MITQLPRPCWLVTPIPPDGDAGDAHCSTRNEALTAAVQANAAERLTDGPLEDVLAGTAVARYTVSQADHRCFVVVCDGECAELLVDGDEEYVLHNDSIEQARRDAEAYDWACERRGAGVWCPTCGVPPFEVPPMPLPGQTAMF